MRSIPAYAGNTFSESYGVGREAGPSPRMRGTPLTSASTTLASAVHPRVCGEHRPHPNRRHPCLPVHPRVCGEHTFLVCGGVWLYGPSPRMRGTLLDGWRPERQIRSIPAYAGNTAVGPVLASDNGGPSPRMRGTLAGGAVAPIMRTVHPRVCGEHELPTGPGYPSVRSIPAYAGNTRCVWLPSDGTVRSIPAYAGNTRGTARSRRR